MRFPQGRGISGPISRKAKWEARPDEKSDDRVVPEARCTPRDRVIGSRGGWGRRSAKVVGASGERRRVRARRWKIPLAKDPELRVRGDCGIG